MPTTDMANQIALLVEKRLKLEIEAQGHKLTNKLINSVGYVIERTGGDFAITFDMEFYGAILDKGVTAARIPFGGKGTGAKTSKYIQGLARFAQLRFSANPKKALGIAFAIAHKQKKQGMPTNGSFKFSKTGKRTDFIGDTLRDVEKDIATILGRIQFDFEVILNAV